MQTKVVILDRVNSNVIIVENIDTWSLEHNYAFDYEEYLKDKLSWFNPKCMDIMVGVNKIEFTEIC